MRLDKFLSATGTLTRTEAKKSIRAKAITVNGSVAKNAEMQIDPNNDEIVFLGKKIIYREFTYIMMNKPDGVVSSTDDGKDKTVIDLLPSTLKKDKLFPCGRLDKNTLGLMLITDNGELAHELLSPRSHVQKSYKFKSAEPISQDDALRFEKGVTLADGYVTKPAKIKLSESGDEGVITLDEGKYHQIKRMLGALNNKIIYLERITFGPLSLDKNLKRGEWRYLTEVEIKSLKEHKSKISEKNHEHN